MASLENRKDIELINPVTLAFLGDAVFSLWVRERLVRAGGGKAADFQRAAAKLESARGQSALIERILPLFTEKEEEIYRRGRNAKKATKSKNADAVDYNRSTGLEAVIGYLYLSGENARIDELLSRMDEEKLQGEKAPTAYKP
ncbi:MAG: Mini-ribonuclease 3 [Clostridia bacterium]|nr:Mini-ribonuclease 3 [Clostridiales bacterium]MBQ3506145.1 Mini-ribonuclease 3 [Clostridia bacterium]